jgi:hypothetical protein
MIEGYRKIRSPDKPPNKPVMPRGELTIFDEPVVTVKKSKRPAEEPDIKRAIKRNITEYM